MTIYVGEVIQFRTSATDTDEAKTPLTDSDVTSTEITIVDSAGAVVQAATSMTYDSTDGVWYYNWTTTGAETFNARMRLIGVTFDTWEYQKVKVKANPTGF